MSDADNLISFLTVPPRGDRETRALVVLVRAVEWMDECIGPDATARCLDYVVARRAAITPMEKPESDR